jgi:capsular exopolysaccharide synthesis family protein
MNLASLQRFNPLLSPRARRYGWVVILCAVVGGVISALQVWRIPDAYVSEGRMIVSGRVNLPNAQSVYSEELANFLGTQLEIMRSEQVTSRARQRLQLERPGLTGDAQLSVGVVQRTSIFQLSATSANRDYARAFLDALMREFIEFKRERRLAVSQNTIEQIASEITRLERELNEAEQQLLVFRQKHNIGYWEQQSASSAKYLSELKDREAKLRLQLSLLDNWKKATSAEGIASSGKIAPGVDQLSARPELAAARQRLISLQIELEQRGAVLKPAHPKMQTLQRELERQNRLISMLEKQLSQDELERRAAINAELASIATAETEWEAKVAESSRIEAEYQRHRSTIDRTRELYNRLVASLQTVDLSKGVDQEIVQVLQPASPARTEAKPVRDQVTSGVLIGAVVGLCVFALISRLDNRTYSPLEAAEILGCRQIGEIPARTAGVFRRTRQRSQSGFDEAVRRLRSLALADAGLRAKPVLLITSAVASEGKTEIALQLAASIASSGKKVLLLDVDLRRGRMHAAFGEEQSPPGMQEFLRGEAAASTLARPTPHAGLFYVPRGNDTDHAGDLLSRTALSERLAELSAGYDLVVIDTAPVGPVDDTNWLLPLAGLVLFVVRINRTPLQTVAEGLGYLRSRQVTDVGLVFNGVQSNHSGKYYEYYQSRG